MGDPVTTGILVGAAMGGGGAALKGQDPLKGALIGGATGGIGGGFAGGFSGAAGTPASGIMGTGAGFAGNNLAAAPTFMQQLSGGAMGVKDVLGGANTFANQNPFTAQAGLSLAKSAFEPEQPMPYAPAGQIQRGSIQPVDYQSLLGRRGQNQQDQYAQQPISLL